MPEGKRIKFKAHTARQVANRLLELARASERTLTPMQLIKLVYLCHGWMLGLCGRPLICDPVEAWAYGPVIRDLYKGVRQFGGGSVEEPLDLWPPEQPPFDDAEENVIQGTYDSYGKFSGPALSRLTHAEGSPWSITYTLSGRNHIISNDLIQDHFANLARQYPTA